MASIDCIAEAIQGSSILSKFYFRLDDTLIDPDVISITTISPETPPVITTYVYDNDVTGNILKNTSVHPDGEFDFTSDPTDADGTWYVEVTITFNLAGGVLRSLVNRFNAIIEDDYKT